MSACSSAYVKSDTDQQIALYTRCITGGDMSKGNLAGAFTNRAVAYMSKGDIERAFADLNSAIRFYPRMGMAYYNRAQIYLRRDDLDAAFADLTSAIKFGPSRMRGSAYSWRAFLQYGRGNCSGAVTDLNDAIVRAAKRGELHALKAWILATCHNQRFRNGTEALKSAQKALSLKDYWESHRALAAAYAELGRFDESVAEMQIAKEQAMQNEGTWRPEHEEMLATLKSGKPLHAEPGRVSVVMLDLMAMGGSADDDAESGDEK
jgi:tetratricopeptide (TPR) repeat protein